MAETKAMTWRSVLCAGLIGVAGLGLAGCAEDGKSTGGDPGAIAMPAGQSCQSVRAELNRLDAKGVRSKIESGRKDPDVDRYNQLLNIYLGARCHV